MDFEKAASFWAEKDETAVKMPRERLMKEVEGFLKSHRTGALATAGGGIVRCTPISFMYRGGRFAILSEGGLKFRALEENRQAALAVFDEYRGPGTAVGLQVSGTTKVLSREDEEYAAELAAFGLPAERFLKMETPLYLIVLDPEAYVFLNAAWKKEGFDVRQTLQVK